MEEILKQAIESAQSSDLVFTKFITANDVGATGAHQAGFHIRKNAWPIAFDSEGEKGANKGQFVTIKWQGEFETQSRFIYYGVGTRNEYRLTRFGRGFPFLSDEHIGDLLILAKKSVDYLEAFVLQADEDIENFFAAINLAANETNGLVPKRFTLSQEDRLLQCFQAYLTTVSADFPSTLNLASHARECYLSSYQISNSAVQQNPDKEVLSWLDAEFQLFKVFENDRYQQRIQRPFETVEELITTANTILNRRKSRAGKSLEHHLAAVFDNFGLAYSTQTTTEGNKKPDFIFPGADAYHNPRFDQDKLVMLAAKTTCKDRWRQILNEADRINNKHLFTLQQGISRNQLEEMYRCNVTLVVPQSYLTSFPKEFRESILTLRNFIDLIRQS